MRKPIPWSKIVETTILKFVHSVCLSSFRVLIYTTRNETSRNIIRMKYIGLRSLPWKGRQSRHPYSFILVYWKKIPCKAVQRLIHTNTTYSWVHLKRVYVGTPYIPGYSCCNNVSSLPLIKACKFRLSNKTYLKFCGGRGGGQGNAHGRTRE